MISIIDVLPRESETDLLSEEATEAEVGIERDREDPLDHQEEDLLRKGIILSSPIFASLLKNIIIMIKGLQTLFKNVFPSIATEL